MDAHAEELTRLDSLQGDGDLGRTAGLIARALRRAVDENPNDVANALRACGAQIAATAPSSSGTLAASAFLASANAVTGAEGDLVVGLRAGIDAIRHRGKAEAGDRTMLDALVPALESLEAAPANLDAAAVAAERGADSTRAMQAKFGRARFLAQNAIGEPDPGAVMVSAALAAAFRPLSSADSPRPTPGTPA
jgi:dihydroxyacetone kinase